MTDEQWQQRIDGLIQGKIKPASSASEYTLQKLRNAKAEFNAVTNNLSQAEQQVTNLRNDALRLDGIMASTIRDLQHWEEEAGAAASPPSVMPAAPPAQTGSSDSKVVDATLAEPAAMAVN